MRIALWILAALAAMAALVVTLVATMAFTYVNRSLEGLPDMNAHGAFDVAQPTKIYSADGKLLANFYLENRQIVKLSQISTDLINAVVAVEDERFYEHKGVDTVGIARALVIDALSGSVKEGASTITQQYVRNTILSKEATQVTATRKLREMFLARELEKRHTKAEILGLYLNAVYFGSGAYGAEAASREYFRKPASRLTLAQASLLAGLPKSPNAYNPYFYMDAAKNRQRAVLQRMKENGYITREQMDEALAEKIVLKKTVDPVEGIYDCEYFVAYVRKQLLTRYPNDLVFKGGLKVYTTINTRMQRYAEAAVHSVLNRKGDPDAGLVSLNPRNGNIVAMYGGRNYRKNHYNTAVQAKRQPGSAFKMFVLVTALEKGIPPSRPMNGSSPAVIPTRPPWRVTGGASGVTLAGATARSVNVVFARLIYEIGARDVARTARRMGITTPVPSYLAIALGGLPRGVSPLEMASAYGTLAAGGVHHRPTSILRIVDSEGNVIFERRPSGERVLSKSIAYAATKILMGVVRGGTGTRASLPGREVAGKTGTTQHNADTWFCGYTPQLSTAIWMGYSKGNVPMRSLHGVQAFGGTFCAPMWRYFMERALRGKPSVDFPTAPAPHYIWRTEWSKEASSSAKPKPGATPKPGVRPKPVPSQKPPPPPTPIATPEPTPPPDEEGTGGPRP